MLFTNDGFYELPLVATGVIQEQAAAAAPTVDVIEYYNASLDHYFITWIAAEIANLDAGNTPTRWTRTGKSFKAYTSAQAGTSQVCRFYIPPTLGNSHYFGRGAAECNATLAAHPEFVLEEPNYMHMFVPTAGNCPTGTQPIYRRLRQPHRRQSPLYQRTRGTRPDGRQGLARRRRRRGSRGDVRAAVRKREQVNGNGNR